MAGVICSESTVRKACGCKADAGDAIKVTTIAACCETEQGTGSCRPAAACCGSVAEQPGQATDTSEACSTTKMPVQCGCC
jgi:hypothetical protein